MSSLVHIDNKKKEILILRKSLTDVSNAMTQTLKKEYSINFNGQQSKLA